MTVTIEVYEADNATLVDTIDPGLFKALRFAELNSQAGGWSVTLPNLVDGEENTALSLLTIGRVVRFMVDDEVRFAGIVEDKDITHLSPEEEVGEVTSVSGRGLAGIFDKVRVRPDAGLDNLPFDKTRQLDYSADRLRDDDPAGPQGEWPLAVATPPDFDNPTPMHGRPLGMVNTSAEFLWSEDVSDGSVPAGVCYFRDRDTFPGGDVWFEMAADDSGELKVDNVGIINNQNEQGVFRGGSVHAIVPISAGEHLIAAKVTNANALKAFVTASWWTVEDGLPKTLIGSFSEATTRVLAYPADPPGFTPTEAVRLVVDEAQNLTPPRLADVTFSFISASDTDSAAVTEVTDLAVDAPGNTVLTFLEMLGETYLDWSVTPGEPLDPWEPDSGTIELNAWNRGTRGSDLSATVEFDKGNCRRVTEEITGSERATVALVMGSRFAPFEVVHADAAIFDIYEEVTLDFGDASRASSEKGATEYLNLVSQARKGTTLELMPGVGPIPYEDFGIGDTVKVMGQNRRVAAIGLTLGADSITRWTVDLDQPRMLLEERLGAIMRRQLPGSAGGRTLLPAPTQPAFVANQAGTEEVHTWQWDGPLGDVQIYKNTVAIPGGVINGADLTSPGDTVKTTLTDAAREFVKESDKIQFSANAGDLSPSWVPPKGRWLQELRATVSDDGNSIVISLMVT